MAFRLDLPDIDDPYEMADWLEMTMFVDKTAQVSRVQLLDKLVAEIGSTPQELDVPVSFLFSEIGRRRRIAGKAYPFVLDNTIIKVEETPSSEFYKFLLLISLRKSPMRKGSRYSEVDEIFDKVVSEAAKNYLGEGSSAIRFGWPCSDGRPKDFAKALDWLSTTIGMPRGVSTSRQSTKDGGVDVVAWKPFADNRSAFVVTLIQCTVRLDWFPKAHDVVDKIWLSRIDTGRDALTSLAIPFVIERNFDKWDDLRRMVNIIFDRLRIAQSLENSVPTNFTKMIKWNHKEMAKFATI